MTALFDPVWVPEAEMFDAAWTALSFLEPVDHDDAGDDDPDLIRALCPVCLAPGRTLTVTRTREGAAMFHCEADGCSAHPNHVAAALGLRPGPSDTLAACEQVFSRWLGADYDQGALHAMLAAAAVEKLDGDPVWLLLVSGPGNAKTETVGALNGAGAVVVSTLSSEAALLSATSRRERATDATGGLLRKLGHRGLLVVKDFTSILSMNRDLRGQVLAALREVYDGRWVRTVGAEGGRSLEWSGRIVVIGAVTTVWDQAHAVVAAMGDRFVLLRMDSTQGRLAAGRRAIANTGDEVQMRAELAGAVAAVLEDVAEVGGPDPAEAEALLAAADLVTLARTAVEFDYRGQVIDAHAPEMPTRFAKQLAQILRGGLAVGMAEADAFALAIRCARDSMPPLRLAIIDYLAGHPDSSTADVRRAVDKPRTTVDRELQALHMLGVLSVTEINVQNGTSDTRTRWLYSLADGINPTALTIKTSPDLSLTTPSPLGEGEGDEASLPLIHTATPLARGVTDKSGDTAAGSR